MTANRLRQAWTSGQSTRGVWCTSPSAVVAEVAASCGVDYVCVDLQHGAVDYPDLVPMLMAVGGQGATPVVRVTANDPAAIGKVLDAGALGVVVPLVSTADEAARTVAACRYPPRGGRSFGPVRAGTVLGSRDPVDLEDVVVAVMVETQRGLDEVEAIAATPGLDAIYLGPADLGLALGLPPVYEHPDGPHAAAVDRIRHACDRAGIVAGIHCADGAMAARRLAQGFRMVTLANDLGLVRSGVLSELEASR